MIEGKIDLVPNIFGKSFLENLNVLHQNCLKHKFNFIKLINISHKKNYFRMILVLIIVVAQFSTYHLLD